MPKRRKINRLPMPLPSIFAKICWLKPYLIPKKQTSLLSMVWPKHKSLLSNIMLSYMLSPSIYPPYPMASKAYHNSSGLFLRQVILRRISMFRTRKRSLLQMNTASMITKEQRKDRFAMWWSECLFGESYTMELILEMVKQSGTHSKTQLD